MKANWKFTTENDYVVVSVVNEGKSLEAGWLVGSDDGLMGWMSDKEFNKRVRFQVFANTLAEAKEIVEGYSADAAWKRLAK